MPPPQVRLQGLQSPQEPQVSLCRLTLGAGGEDRVRNPSQPSEPPQEHSEAHCSPLRCLKTALPHPLGESGFPSLQDSASPPDVPNRIYRIRQLSPQGADSKSLCLSRWPSPAAPALCRAGWGNHQAGGRELPPDNAVHWPMPSLV